MVHPLLIVPLPPHHRTLPSRMGTVPLGTRRNPNVEVHDWVVVVVVIPVMDVIVVVPLSDPPGAPKSPAEHAMDGEVLPLGGVVCGQKLAVHPVATLPDSCGPQLPSAIQPIELPRELHA